MNKGQSLNFGGVGTPNVKAGEVPSPEESGRIESHENVYFANGNYERRSSKLADENASC